jgi:hypothetical protein
MFDKHEMYNMVEWFQTHAIDGIMRQQDFLEAMGFTSHAAYIFERMFLAMDNNNDGQVLLLRMV